MCRCGGQSTLSASVNMFVLPSTLEAFTPCNLSEFWSEVQERGCRSFSPGDNEASHCSSGYWRACSLYLPQDLQRSSWKFRTDVFQTGKNHLCLHATCRIISEPDSDRAEYVASHLPLRQYQMENWACTIRVLLAQSEYRVSPYINFALLQVSIFYYRSMRNLRRFLDLLSPSQIEIHLMENKGAIQQPLNFSLWREGIYF